MADTQTYDAIIIGAGHNGLVCGFYLAKAGMRVRILEALDVAGGCAVTQEFHPGFRNSVASYTVSLLQPKIIADMELVERGYRVIERPLSNFLPLPGGDHLLLGGGLERTQAEFARFSAADAAALPAYYDMLEDAAGLLRHLALRTPPNSGGGLSNLLSAAQAARPFLKLSIARQQAVLALFTRSAREILDSWFETEAVKAAFGFDAVVGNFASPDAPGSAYVLLHHVFGEVNGKSGVWGHVVGGMGAITQMMAQAAADAGAQISLNSRVAEIISDGGRQGKGRATGVRLASGEALYADRIITNVGPKLTAKLAGTSSHPDWPVGRYATGSGSFRMNVALSALPSFSAMPGNGDHLKSGIVIAPSLDYMDRAFQDAKAYGWSKSPVVEMLIPSLADDSLAPPRRHVASPFCQQLSPILPGGRDWDDDEEAAADTIISAVAAQAPGFEKLILARQILSPKGLERRFGLSGGDIFHGRMSLDQLWGARPWLGSADYRLPMDGLYLCGSAAHPGGGVTGAPGHNCAAEILKERSFTGKLGRMMKWR
jgi:phytoene dehydrogenase-like protein